MYKYSLLFFICYLSISFPVSAQVVRSSSGANAAAIQASVDAFRADLGSLNANVAGSFGTGRREINWDGVADALSAPNNLPANFFNVNSPRGVVFSTPGTGFQVSSTAASGIPVEFSHTNATYSTLFAPFTPQRLFTALGSTVTDINFFFPGSTTAAQVRGFGAVFSDVDLASITSIQYFDINNASLGTFFVPATAGNETFSFLGVSFPAAVISRVRITCGNAALGAAVSEAGATDLVVMDDFIYAEPVSGLVTLRSISGLTGASIQAIVDQYRVDLGTLNANVASSFGTGRREINWDGVPAAFAAPNNLPPSFFHINSPRGVVLSTPGTGLQVSANAATPPVEFGNLNATYSSLFAPFSAQRLFTSLSSTITDVNFLVPGLVANSALVRGFGAVFSDVDLAGVTGVSSIQFFDKDNISLGTYLVPAIAGNETFSFLGISYVAPTITRVRITSGNTPLGIDETAIADLVVMDDFIYGEPVAPSNITDFYRTKASGNWSDANTWESSTDNITWQPATLAPDFNANTITILNGHTVTVTANVTTDQTVVNSGGAVNVNPAIAITINDGAGTDVTVSGGGSFTLKSTAVGTASVANSAGTTSGNFTIERFIPARRAWRFLAAPVSSAGAPTINASWQEGVTTASGTPNPNPGFGTHITGGSVANGFDQSPANSASLKIYNNITPAIDQNNWVGIASTLTPITGAQGYMLFVRGSRANNLSQGTSAVADNTTLRITGGLKTGTQNIGINATGFTVVGNPYPSAINLNSLAKTNGSTNVADNFFVWDPKMAGTFGVGAYVNIIWNPGTSVYDITPTPVSPVSQHIQSGQAFFATSTGIAGNLIIKETDKTVLGSDNVFRLTSSSTSEQKIRTNLYQVNADGTTSIVDGTLNSYNNIFSNAIDKFDAAKLTNFGENIGIVRDGKTLIVERRDAVGDDINFKMWQMNQQDYQLEVIAENIDPNVSPILQDKYLKTNTPLNVNGTTKINFSVTADAASAAENRFSIVFVKPALVQPANPSIIIYPNPATNGLINLKFDNMPKGNYRVRVVNNLGQTVVSKIINHSQATSIETVRMNKKGAYHVEITKPDNTKYITKVIAD